MNEADKKELQAELESQRQQITNDVSRHGATGKGVGVIADETERADKIAENMVEHQLGYSESKLLEKIDYALERLDAGTYGICDDCKEQINIERLKAKPSVSLCIECQTKKESGAK
ncbi:MAG: TraR/DksA family transcriptional regulator [Akkermansiaceae bacterium]